MKKTIIGLSGLIIMTFFVIFAVNAQNNDQKSKKQGTEVSQNISQCPSMASGSCCSGTKMANCSGGSCSAMNCNASKCKAGKCDPATCNGGKCDQATCKTNCGGASTALRGGPMNCNRDIAIAAK
jgi:hypothetical protein